MPAEARSIDGNIVEPVVVMPDTDSKIESMMDSSKSDSKNGRAPNRPIDNHALLVSKKACRKPISKSA